MATLTPDRHSTPPREGGDVETEHPATGDFEIVKCDYAGCKEMFPENERNKHMEQYTSKHMSLMANRIKSLEQEKDNLSNRLGDSQKKNSRRMSRSDTQMQLSKNEHKEMEKRVNDLQNTISALQKQAIFALCVLVVIFAISVPFLLPVNTIKEENTQIKELQISLNQVQQRDSDLRKKLDEQVTAWENKISKQMKTGDKNYTALKVQMDKFRDEMEYINKIIQRLSLVADIPEYRFTVKQYTKLQTIETPWSSEPFRTHEKGYKGSILVWLTTARDKQHISVGFQSVPGEFDATLPWPVKVTFTLQLVNQHRDQDHWTATETFEWKRQKTNTFVGTFSHTLISHNELGWNAEKQTQYLKGNHLQFRVTKIEIHKSSIQSHQHSSIFVRFLQYIISFFS